ncbi:hypothetical protein SAM19_01463 [Brevibacillus laterosporus]|nr:hypothetical protein [Brevibacillus laterosporus]
MNSALPFLLGGVFFYTYSTTIIIMKLSLHKLYVFHQKQGVMLRLIQRSQQKPRYKRSFL